MFGVGPLCLGRGGVFTLFTTASESADAQAELRPTPLFSLAALSFGYTALRFSLLILTSS